jgi:hypothetical protein
MSIIEYKTTIKKDKEQLTLLLDLHFVVAQLIIIPITTIILYTVMVSMISNKSGAKYCNF